MLLLNLILCHIVSGKHEEHLSRYIESFPFIRESTWIGYYYGTIPFVPLENSLRKILYSLPFWSGKSWNYSRHTQPNHPINFSNIFGTHSMNKVHVPSDIFTFQFHSILCSTFQLSSLLQSSQRRWIRAFVLANVNFVDVKVRVGGLRESYRLVFHSRMIR